LDLKTIIAISAVVVAFFCGGLGGAIWSSIRTHRKELRQLRTKFYPTVSNIYAAYVIRMDNPSGRYLVQVPDSGPSSEDQKFVDHRTAFVLDLTDFNELPEARHLRTQMANNMFKIGEDSNPNSTLDLAPEAKAINVCLTTLHKKLKLEN